MNGLDIDKVVQGIREAVIDDLIKDLQALKLELKVIKRNDLIKKIMKKGRN